jgi:hypothetical protein
VVLGIMPRNTLKLEHTFQKKSLVMKILMENTFSRRAQTLITLQLLEIPLEIP